MTGVLTKEQQKDLADATMRFERFYAEALGDNWRDELAKRKKVRFALNPVCDICEEKIPHIDSCALWEPVNMSPMLICTREECFTKTLQESMGRYLERALR